MVFKSVLQMTLDVVREIVRRSAQSIIRSELYGEEMTKLIGKADLKLSDLFVSSFM